MTHDKSVEETMADVLCEEIMVSPKNKAEKTIKAALIKAYQYGQRQTSQEREREIVLEAIRLSDEAERGNETEFNEWRAFKGFRNGLRDWAKEKGITNPNKD